MKKLALILLFMSAFCWAAKKPNPADYTVPVHVTASHLQLAPERPGCCFYQHLNVVIDGKKYDLTSLDEIQYSGGAHKQYYTGNAHILAPGDYKARLVKDEHKTTYESADTYEFLLPDNNTMTFLITGVAE